MAFDVVLMNPPYQSGLHLRFLAKALEMLKPDGICISLQPTAWQKYSTVEENQLAKSIIALEQILAYQAKKFFKGATMMSDLGIYTCMNQPRKFKTLCLSDEVKNEIIKEHDIAKAECEKILSDKIRLSLFSQYFTEPFMSIKMLEKLDTLKDKDIIDIASGSGNLLAAAVIAGADPKRCYGIELDKKMRDFSAQRLSKLGVPSSNIQQGNSIVNYDDVAIYVTLLPCKCLVQYLRFPDEVFSTNVFDLSYSIGKELLCYLLNNAKDENQKIIFNAQTSLVEKFDNAICIDRSEIYRFAQQNNLKSFNDLQQFIAQRQLIS